MKFAVIERREDGINHWLKLNSNGFGMINAGKQADRLPPDDFYLPGRIEAENWRNEFEMQHARDVERTKRCRKNKTVPATYEIIKFER